VTLLALDIDRSTKLQSCTVPFVQLKIASNACQIYLGEFRFHV